MLRAKSLASVLFLGLMVPPIYAQGLWNDLYRGLQLFSTPSGGPLGFSQDGSAINGNRNGRTRIVPNQLGNGWRLELDRTFGTDSRGRPEIFDAGLGELELSGSTSATLGFTRRGLPHKPIFIGSGDFAASNLNYALRFKSGAQDAELTGTLNAASTFEINQLGFYEVDLNVQNTTSSLTLDGVAVDSEDRTDFDIGPIALKGNIFVDGAVALLRSAGVDTSAIEQLFPGSPIGRIGDEIEAQIRAANVAGVTFTRDGVDTASLMADAQTAVVREMFSYSLRSSLAPVIGGNAALTAPASDNGQNQSTPEPATWMLIAGGALLALRRRAR
ncbi:MAG: hypothetical protein CHACPFDD_00431 [Phycisphaerae bacterium]|nr:hypothetical protein [Phycisphaerae bacterium]